MNLVLDAASDLQLFCEERGWQACIIGGVAIQRWGEPRVTRDVDVTLLTGFGQEEKFVDALLARYKSRISGAREFGLLNRVVLLRSTNGVGLDVALAGLPFEKGVVRRSSLSEFEPGRWLRTCSAEDLVVMKAFAGRPQDWIDVERIIIRQGDKLDWKLIQSELKPLCELKEAPENLTELERLHQKLKRA